MQAVIAQGTAVSAIQAVAGAAAESSQRASAKNVGVKFSSYNGTALVIPAAGFGGKAEKSSSSIRGSPARANLFGNLKNLKTDILNPLKPSSDSVEVKGRLVLSRRSILDLVNVNASIIDDNIDLIFNQSVVINLVSVEAKPDGQPKLSAKSTIVNWITATGIKEKLIAGDESYAVTFHVPKDFGEIGAIVVRNKHFNEFFLHEVALETSSGVTYQFPCKSWVYPDNILDADDDRVFFTNKTYLPGQTPSGLKRFRESELVALRGNGKGIRTPSQRIYDYAVYNDLGKPDLLAKRPTLGGNKDLPYPRRCRTGRVPALADPKAESNIPIGSIDYYNPCDECFERDKNSGFYAGALKSINHALAPVISGIFDDTCNTWDSIEEIMEIYSKGLDLGTKLADTDDEEKKKSLVFLNTIFKAEGDSKSVIKYPKPQLIKEDENAWMDDEEFGRQTLAGLNPCVIELVTEYPPKSSLDPSQYGAATALTEKHIEPYLEGLSVKEAIEAKRLFKVDYRDLFLPYIERINNTKYKAYASRAFFFRTKTGAMKPVAIELSLPPTEQTGASNRVFTPPLRKEDTNYFWELAKAHFATIDFGYHELISHWLRTHAVMEPFIISTHRNLSKLHPVHTLLLPLYKNTMRINAAARQHLISGMGIIELCFTPGKYSMEMCSKIYGALWRFDHEAFPANLIARGMAEPADASQPGGVKLVVDDYPFAKDGLELWDVIKSYMGKYLNIAYKGSDKAVQEDVELQRWWNEVVQIGHGDKKDEPWWPNADSIQNLTHICTTIAWISGPHHAAVNFGQYAYAGFMPNRPSHLKKLIPEEGSKEEDKMLEDPQKWLMETLTSQSATAIILTVLELLSSHAIDEEYQGKRLHDNWTSDPEIKAAFTEFSAKIDALQRKFEERNADKSLVNRTAGPAKLPYMLLYPHSAESGLTGRGVPYSISI
ncbi:hypothetical protein R1flu_027146 [Riccia fluitans]|uniref:Lipoxygenase n=1 Tax=Riccia fluitans TaxID=41844 RepID=A0ABD1XHY3_9MARC